MMIRLKLLQGATAALYMGPLLAGMAGFGWAMVPPFLSVFLWFLMVLRPHHWPRRNSDWLRGATWVSVIAQLASQLLLVSVLFGIGRGLGGAMGHLPLFHPALPVAISFIAIPLVRLVWNSQKALELGLTIDEVLYPKPRASVTVAVPRNPSLTPEAAILPLLDMADAAPLTVIGPALEDVLDDSAAWARLAALAAALDGAPDKHRALREALVIWATDPELFAASAAPAAMRVAFGAAGTDLALLARLLPRAAALARLLPHLHAQFPDASVLNRIAAQPLPAQVAQDLAGLRSALGQDRKGTGKGVGKGGSKAAGAAALGGSQLA